MFSSFLISMPTQFNGENIAFQHMVLRQLDDYTQHNENKSLPHTIYKMGHRPKCKNYLLFKISG